MERVTHHLEGISFFTISPFVKKIDLLFLSSCHFIKPKTSQKMNFTILSAIFLCLISGVAANTPDSHHSHRGIQNQMFDQKTYNDHLMAKPTIGINDRIWYNKAIPTEFQEKLCPYIQELLVFQESKYYVVLGYTLENYHEYLLKNVSDFYMEEIYTLHNYPTYRENVTLENVTMSDVYLYHKLQCKKYPVNGAMINRYRKVYSKLYEGLVTKNLKTNTINPNTKKIPNAYNNNCDKKNSVDINPFVIFLGLFCVFSFVGTGGGTRKRI